MPWLRVALSHMSRTCGARLALNRCARHPTERLSCRHVCPGTPHQQVERLVEHQAHRVDIAASRKLDSAGRGKLQLFSRLLTGSSSAPALVRSAQAMDDVASAVDTAALTLGRFLRHSVVARLGCAAYGVLLHIWLFIVMVQMAPSPHSNSPS